MNHVPLSISLPLLIAVITGLPSHARAEGQEWGDLQGRIVLDGKYLRPKKIPIDKDQQVLGKSTDDRTLMIHPENRGIANIVIYLKGPRGKSLKIHPSYAQTAQAKKTLTVRKGQLEPHILLLRTSQTLVQKNLDPIPHNVKFDLFRNSPS